jgi:excisionase family DNA binding protein
MTIRALPSYQNKDGVPYMSKRKKPEQNIERIFLTFAEAQEYLGISHQTLYKLIEQGLPSHKIGKKRVFLKEDLIQWISG